MSKMNPVIEGGTKYQRTSSRMKFSNRIIGCQFSNLNPNKSEFKLRLILLQFNFSDTRLD